MRYDHRFYLHRVVGMWCWLLTGIRILERSALAAADATAQQPAAAARRDALRGHRRGAAGAAPARVAVQGALCAAVGKVAFGKV